MPRDNDQDGTPQGVFGAELRYYRERADLSQTELAALVNVSHDVIRSALGALRGHLRYPPPAATQHAGLPEGA